MRLAQLNAGMRERIFVATVLALLVSNGGFAQKQELGLTMGRILGTDRSLGATTASTGSGLALQANYDYRLVDGDWIALYAEANMLANPLREVASTNGAVTRDYASLYLTSGFRVKLMPDARLSPFTFVGGGLAWYEQSTTNLAGSANGAPRNLYRGAVTFGAGADLVVRSWLALRGEVRDFYTGSPAYNVAIAGGQHNLSLTGGFVLRWGE